MTAATLLPAELPLFPLKGAILLPGEYLPLNVFEPRYLNMVDDARREGGHIGIIQSRAGRPDLPELELVGCAGRIEEFSETDDGRYLINLKGVARFTLVREIASATPYRVARAHYGRFEADLQPRSELSEDRDRLTYLLQAWFHAEDLTADWKSLSAAPLGSLVDRLAMIAPFEPEEKQRLLEAFDVRQRLSVMEDIIAARLADNAGGPAH